MKMDDTSLLLLSLCFRLRLVSSLAAISRSARTCNATQVGLNLLGSSTALYRSP